MRIIANNIKIEVEDFGSKNGIPLLLINGFGSQLINWPLEFIDKFLEKDIRVIIFDNRDVGLSHKFSGQEISNMSDIWKYSFSSNTDSKITKKPTVPYTINDMAADAESVLKALDIRSAHVLGTSMGGMIAQLFAYNYPVICRSLTSMMSTSNNPDLPRISKKVREGLTGSPKNNDISSIINYNMETRKLWSSPKFPTPEEELIENYTASYERMFYPEGQTRQYAAIGHDGSRVERLKKIISPTLVLHGDSDNLVPVEGGIDTAKLIPNARLEILEGWGHDLPPGVFDWVSSKICEHIFSNES